MMMNRTLLAASLLCVGLAMPAQAQDASAEARPDGRPSALLIAQNCGTCHGLEGRVFTESMPPLAGMNREKFVAAMIAFRDDQRPATIMDRLAKAFTEDDFQAMADYYAALPAEPLPTQEASR